MTAPETRQQPHEPFKYTYLETNDIIYLVAFALILRVIIKVVVKYRHERKQSDHTTPPDLE